jgi:hypothetical protein
MRQGRAGCMEAIDSPVTVQVPSLPMWSGDLDQLAGLTQQLARRMAELDSLVAVAAVLQSVAIAGCGTATEQLDDGIAAVGDRDQPPLGQPAGEQQEKLARPVGRLLVAATLLPRKALRRSQRGQEWQGPHPTV